MKINGQHLKNQMHLHFRKTSLNHETQMPKNTYEKNVESLSL